MKAFVKSFVYALRGVFFALVQERNIKVHLVVFLCVCVLGFYFSITQLEWLFILCISALVISLELINSSIERLCDLYTEERNEQIRRIKDIAAGAVLFAALIAIVIGLIIFIPKI